MCKRKEFQFFQLLESFKKKVLMHHPSIKKSLVYLIEVAVDLHTDLVYLLSVVALISVMEQAVSSVKLT